MPTAEEWFEPTKLEDEQFPQAKTTVEQIAEERNALRDEVAELKALLRLALPLLEWANIHGSRCEELLVLVRDNASLAK